jgi:hypothetical protein
MDAFDSYRLTGRRVAGVAWNGSGQTKGGLHVAYNQYLYPVYFRVLATSPACELLAPGDIVRVPPLVWDDVDLPDFHCQVMDERRAIYIITPRKDAA